MDEIQKVLVKAGRKDLAHKYYLKVAGLTKELKTQINQFIDDSEKLKKEYLPIKLNHVRVNNSKIENLKNILEKENNNLTKFIRSSKIPYNYKKQLWDIVANYNDTIEDFSYKLEKYDPMSIHQY
jgi:hypothetical protein